MSMVSPEVRRYRILCVGAVVHAALLLASVWYASASERQWPVRLWVGLVTLWFVWPLILAFHAGSSARRVYAALGAAAALLALPMHAYCSIFGGHILLPNDGPHSLSPYALGPFAVGYVRGWTAAKQRAGLDPIILEGYGLGGDHTPAAPQSTEEVREKCRIEIEPIALCGVTPYILGHAKGYNVASVAEIKRRYGSAIIVEAKKADAEQQARLTAEHTGFMSGSN